MTYKNQTIALVYEDDLFTIYDGNQIRQFNSFDGMVNAITWKKKSNKLIIWCYKLSEMIFEIGEDKFDKVQKHTLRSYIIKFANLNNIVFRNLKEFYRIPLNDIKHQLCIEDNDDLMITYKAAEYERNRNNGKISKIPITSIGYVKRELDKLHLEKEFRELALSITEDTHNVLVKCNSGGLCGIDDLERDTEQFVNCYDFKSFYPWIMYTQEFPCHTYVVKHNPTNSQFSKYYKENKLWIATIKFKYFFPLEKDWLKIARRDSFTITITSLDFKIIQNSYKYAIDCIEELIVFKQPKLLPDKLREYIKHQFIVKETFEKHTTEYEQAKIFLNCIFGLFYQNPTQYGKPCNCWTARQRPMVIGLFTASYGRYFLWDIMHEHNPLHWDTDGFKTKSTLDLTEYNNNRRVEDIMLGQLICEKEFVPCTVFGNKQYMLENELKIAGTSGKLAMEYFNKIGRKPHCGDVIPPEYTSQVRVVKGKLTGLPFTIGKDY